MHDNKKCLINQREVRTHTSGFKDALRAADVSPRGRETINELIRKVWESERRPE